MDEIWQRHKSFILQVFVGGIVFLVAFLVMHSVHGDANDPQRLQTGNARKKADLEKRIREGRAPAAKRIAEQRGIADAAEKQKAELARRIASVAPREARTEAERERAYVRENIEWVLRNIQGEDKGYLALYERVPQACLSQLREAAHRSLVGRAAQAGKEMDETLGLSAGFPDEEIPAALHGLALVTEVAGRALARPGIERIQGLQVSTSSQFPSQALEEPVGSLTAMRVHFEVTGEPADVFALLRSFNSAAGGGRMVVLESLEHLVPLSADEDAVKAVFNVVGLRTTSKTGGDDRAENP